MSIIVHVEGVMGGGLRNLGKKGCAAIQMRSSGFNHTQEILVDAFEGRGENYRPRETERIVFKNGNESVTFESFEEFFAKLKG